MNLRSANVVACAWVTLASGLFAAGVPLKVPVVQVEMGIDKQVKMYPGRVVPVAQVNVIPQVSG